MQSAMSRQCLHSVDLHAHLNNGSALPDINTGAQVTTDNITMQEFIRMQQNVGNARVPPALAPQAAHQHHLPLTTARPNYLRSMDSPSDPHNSGTISTSHNSHKSAECTGPSQKLPSPTCGYLTLMTAGGLIRLPVCPSVLRFVDSPFYKTINVIVPPTIMTPTEFIFTPGKRSYERLLNFRINPDQAETITYHSRRLDDNRREFGVQVIMRFGKLEPSVLVDIDAASSSQSSCSTAGTTTFPPFVDSMPIHLFVQVNGRLAPLPPLLPTSRPNMDGRRNARPVHITPLLRVSPSTSNHVKLTWTHEYSTFSYHFFAIYLVRKHSTKELCEALRRHAYQHAPVTQKQIIDKLASNANSSLGEGLVEEGDDDDLQIQNTLPVQLLCPLSKCRISLPVRGRKCQHIQCYDANTYLLINERKPAWKCPVCDSLAPFHELLVDGLLVDILSAKESQDVEEIIFNEDGSWSSVGVIGAGGSHRKFADAPPSPSAAGSGSSSPPHLCGNPLKRSASTNTTTSTVSTCNEHSGGTELTIDLTESDDETEPTGKRQPPPAPNGALRVPSSLSHPHDPASLSVQYGATQHHLQQHQQQPTSGHRK
uniref:SP-RING-type domain-containing protein n=1 Tax=Mesocestoides corti TaxID=53468 RepID=A0A5K3EJJ7_MESCO